MSTELSRQLPAGSNRVHLAGKTADEIESVVASLGMPRYTARQILRWLYEKRVGEIDFMTDLSRQNRELLSRQYDVGYAAPRTGARSVDGTAKYLFSVEGAPRGVEAVYIPDRDRGTLCVSSQVGCKMNCRFCMTGKQGFEKSLTAFDIVNQIVSVPESSSLTNLVFMGMGEPFDNLDELLKALRILTSDWGFGWSPRRITVSTVGLLKGTERFLRESRCHLAVSLHSPFPDERLSLMPVEKAQPSSRLLALLRSHDFSGQRRLSFEYILFEGLNDSSRHAEALAQLLRGLPCRVNLIRFHAVPGVPLKSPEEAGLIAFREALNRRGIVCTIRASRGEDILAACGLLSTAAEQAENPDPKFAKSPEKA